MIQNDCGNASESSLGTHSEKQVSVENYLQVMRLRRSSDWQLPLSGFYDFNQVANFPTWRYYYDGQMPHMEDFTAKANSTTNLHVDVTRYGLGAQGIDLISAQRVDGPANDPLMAPQNVDPLYPNSTQRVSFPVYDGHGNMICTVARNGEGYSVQNVKRYDVWGGVRSDSGASSSSSGGHLANTDKRYCANLGHATDIETGLIYMRARYYEPTTGRFISEDPARDGSNWTVYANCKPTVLADPSGETPSPVVREAWLTKIVNSLVWTNQPRPTGAAFLTLWMGWLMNEGRDLISFDSSGVADCGDYFLKVSFAREAGGKILLTPTLAEVGDAKSKAKAVASMYSACLSITMWIVNDLY